MVYSGVLSAYELPTTMKNAIKATRKPLVGTNSEKHFILDGL
jgi:hypothetical protein